MEIKEMKININNKLITIKNLKDGYKKFQKYTDKIGASQMKKYDGRISLNNKPYARVSYNGRVWEYGKKWILSVEEHNKLKELLK